MMTAETILKLPTHCVLKAQNGGLFISRGQGTHPTRIIDSHELIFVKEGQLELWEDDQTFIVEAGQTLHLWPRRRHGGVGTLPAGLEFYWIHFELMDAVSGANEAVVVPQLSRVSRPEKLESLFRHFLDDQESGYLEACAANLLVMLMLMEAARPASNHKDDSDISMLATRANTYIETHFHDPITPGKVAEALGYNPDYLERVYRKVYGQTLTEFIHRSRVRHACTFLLDTDMTIEQIARACGFSDADYFRRIFRRYQQSSPSAYRQLFTRVYVNTH